MSGPTTKAQAALSKLVAALTAPDHETPQRVNLIEDALNEAAAALGEPGVERERLLASLETFAAHVLVDKLDREQLSCIRISVLDGTEEDAVIVASALPKLSSAIHTAVDTHLREASDIPLH